MLSKGHCSFLLNLNKRSHRQFGTIVKNARFNKFGTIFNFNLLSSQFLLHEIFKPTLCLNDVKHCIATQTTMLSIEDIVKVIEMKISIKAAPALKPAELQKTLGRFFKVPLPFSSGMLDPRLFDDTTGIVAKEILENMYRNDFILLGQSGIGKTRSIFDSARSVYTVYMQCVLVSENAENKKEPTIDQQFNQLYLDCKYACAEIKDQVLRNKAVTTFIRTAILSRLLYLRLFKKNFPNATPTDFLISQLNGGATTIREIYQLVKIMNLDLGVLDYLTTSLSNILQEEVTGGKKILWAVDEAGVAAKLLPEKFESPTSKSLSGFLTPIVAELGAITNLSCIYAATNRSFGTGDALESDIGKPNQVSVITEFPLVRSIDTIKQELNGKLNLEGCDLNKIPETQYLIGRPRLLSQVFLELSKLEQKFGDFYSKQQILRDSIVASIEEHREKLAHRFKQALSTSIHDKENILIKKLYLAAQFFDGRVSFVLDNSKDLDLVHIGLASLHRWPVKQVYYTAEVEEPLSISVIKEVLSVQSPLKPVAEEFRRKIDDKLGPSYFEIACAFSLLHYSQTHPSITVADFASEFLDEDSIKKLPPWTKEAQFKVAGIGNNKTYNVTDELEFAEQAFADKLSAQLLVRPSNYMRPDALQINLLSRQRWWALCLSAKLYGEKLAGKKILADLRSTNIEHFYQQTNENVDSATNKRQKWLSLKNPYKHEGSLRIHCILPEVTHVAKHEIQNNDVIIYINLKNAMKLFGPDIMNNLNKFYNTDGAVVK